jgi:hypothetical protein
MTLMECWVAAGTQSSGLDLRLGKERVVTVVKIDA